MNGMLMQRSSQCSAYDEHVDTCVNTKTSSVRSLAAKGQQSVISVARQEQCAHADLQIPLLACQPVMLPICSAFASIHTTDNDH